MTKKEKIEIGKKIHDGEMTVKDAADAVGLVLDNPPSKEPSVDAVYTRGFRRPQFEGFQDYPFLLLGGPHRVLGPFRSSHRFFPPSKIGYQKSGEVFLPVHFYASTSGLTKGFRGL